MDISEFAKQYQAKMFGGENCPLAETDPEFVERFSNFAFDEVVNSGELDGKTRFLAILATLLGCCPRRSTSASRPSRRRKSSIRRSPTSASAGCCPS